LSAVGVDVVRIGVYRRTVTTTVRRGGDLSCALNELLLLLLLLLLSFSSYSTDGDGALHREATPLHARLTY